MWYFIFLKTHILTLLSIKKLSKLHISSFCSPDLGRHPKFERLLIVWGHWTVTIGSMLVVFKMPPCEFSSLLKNNYINFCPWVYHSIECLTQKYFMVEKEHLGEEIWTKLVSCKKIWIKSRNKYKTYLHYDTSKHQLSFTETKNKP